VDQVLFDGTKSHDTVEVAFGTAFESLEQDATGVTVTLTGPDGAKRKVRGKYLVGCDGGRSPVRKAAGISFEGQTEATKWIVVDLEKDPVGVPNTILYCDPVRPFVSIALPHAVRRLEFMVMPGKTEDELTSREGLHGLLGRIVARPETAEVIRSRVYTHHSRIADRFREGRVLIAGDAAHLMPVWQGQGYNSGIRDANNLGWKLIEVLSGRSGDRLFDSYTEERREHAQAMIRLSTTAGRIFSPTNRALARARDVLFATMSYIPPVRDYIVQCGSSRCPPIRRASPCRRPRARAWSGGCSRSRRWPEGRQFRPAGRCDRQPLCAAVLGDRPDRLHGRPGAGLLAQAGWQDRGDSPADRVAFCAK